MMSKAKAKKQSPVRRRAKETRPLVSELSEEARIAHYSAVLVEDLKSQFKLVIEHVEGIREALGQKIDILEQKVDKLEQRVDKGFAENERRWQENERRWQENKQLWQENKRLWQENDGWQHEAIKTLGRIESKLDNHEERITHLESVVHDS